MTVDGADLPSSSRTAPARRTTPAPVTALFLALLPVTWVAFDVLALELFGASDSAMGSLLFATLLSWAVVGADSAALRRAGVQVSAWWGILLLPVYLILRTRRARSSLAVPAVFFALAVAYLVSADLILDRLDLP
ncbi:hypothetical protein ACFVWG_13715 [Kribbella sp. NPDC058245]|jgi:hypothetical protein|uniref:hypothetical protein n=1 Tax=Kribbella TaxID=182639 RepID=UPI0010484119|nr:hypothetical protein [Kribbella albertanoniae]